MRRRGSGCASARTLSNCGASRSHARAYSPPAPARQTEPARTECATQHIEACGYAASASHSRPRRSAPARMGDSSERELTFASRQLFAARPTESLPRRIKSGPDGHASSNADGDSKTHVVHCRTDRNAHAGTDGASQSLESPEREPLTPTTRCRATNDTAPAQHTPYNPRVHSEASCPQAPCGRQSQACPVPTG